MIYSTLPIQSAGILQNNQMTCIKLLLTPLGNSILFDCGWKGFRNLWLKECPPAVSLLYCNMITHQMDQNRKKERDCQHWDNLALILRPICIRTSTQTLVHNNFSITIPNCSLLECYGWGEERRREEGAGRVIWCISVRISFHPLLSSIPYYYMASSASRQDDPNCAMWLATRAGKMEPSCPLRTTRCILQEKFTRKPCNKSFIDQVCLVKMAGYWPRSFFASL